jgi:hypothetical protein
VTAITRACDIPMARCRSAFAGGHEFSAKPPAHRFLGAKSTTSGDALERKARFDAGAVKPRAAEQLGPTSLSARLNRSTHNPEWQSSVLIYDLGFRIN